MFNESEWIKLLFLLADTQIWLDDMAKQAFLQLPLPNKKIFFCKTYYLTCSAMAHIIERHYYKIPRHPAAGKFHIPVAEILYCIKEASALPATPVPGSLNFQRTLNIQKKIGFSNTGEPANAITVLTDAAGKIITAFPSVSKAI